MNIAKELGLAPPLEGAADCTGIAARFDAAFPAQRDVFDCSIPVRLSLLCVLG